LSVLDTIDTTVSLEFGATRTVGTLLELTAHMAVITALKLPEEGGELNVVVEGDDPDESVTLDCICVSVSETAWGEQQAEVEVLRVGTTCSASRLRDFIEQYAVARGGSVHIGQNRDNPNQKRFVYHVPDRLDGAFTATRPTGVSRGGTLRETAQFGHADDIASSAPNKNFKTTDRMAGGVGFDGEFGPERTMPDVDIGFAGVPDRTMPDAKVDPALLSAAIDEPSLFGDDAPFDALPERTLPDADIGTIGGGDFGDSGRDHGDFHADEYGRTDPSDDRFAGAFSDDFAAPAVAEPEVDISAVDLPKTPPPRNTVNGDIPTLGFGGDSQLDMAMREALAAVGARKATEPLAMPAGGDEDELEPTAMISAMPDEEPEPTRQMDAVAFDAPIPDAGLDPLAALDPLAPMPEDPNATKQLDAIGDDPFAHDPFSGGGLGDDAFSAPGVGFGGGTVGQPDGGLGLETAQVEKRPPSAAKQFDFPPADDAADGHDPVAAAPPMPSFSAKDGGAVAPKPISPASLMADLEGDEDSGAFEEHVVVDEAEAAALMQRVDAAIALERAIADSEYYDHNEQIVVNTVPAGVPFADPVKLGRDNKAPSLRNIAPADQAARRSGATAPAPAPVPQPSTSHRRMPSDALQKVQSVFSVDFALRTEFPVQFQGGRKKRDGVVIRLAESRLRIRSEHQPKLYELLKVHLPPPPGEKRKVTIRCEVTRIREVEEGGDLTAFDMRISGGNSPKVMNALRQLIKSFETPNQPAA